MRKKLLICALLGVFLFLPKMCSNTEVKHPPGRDTVNLFGDGSFQICKSPKGNTSLYYYSEGAPIIGSVEDYCEIQSKVYLTGYLHGMKQYAVIELDTNKVYLCVIDLESGREIISPHLFPSSLVENGTIVIQLYFDFTEADRKVFSELG